MKFSRLLVTLFFFIHFSSIDVDNISSTKQNQSSVHIGLILDLDSAFGSMVNLCIDMAITDFYSAHPYYKTRLKLHTKNTKTLVDVNFAVQELLMYDKVHGVLVPQESVQHTFAAQFGERVHVPFIFFTAKTSALSYDERRYSVWTTPDDSVQTRALAGLFHGFGWPQVVLLYEDTEYGNHFLSHLNKALQEVEIGLANMIAFPSSVKDDQYLWKELHKLQTMQTRVFIVHMNPSLGYRLFAVANKVGMMSEGYAWIITDSLSNFMNSMDSATRDSMEGVVGIRPYVKDSRDLQSFHERWKRNVLLKNPKSPVMELNIYGLWAYDAIHALAIAVEKIGPVNSSSLFENGTKDSANLSISSYGPGLISELSAVKFKGLNGDYFQLVDGQLKASTYEIINVAGNGEKTVGFWNPNRGILGKGLKQIIWPGDSMIRPKGWAVSTIGKLRVGVPWKSGFTEFVNVSVDPTKNHIHATGFSVDIFLASLQKLPFPVNYEFHCYNDTNNINWSYDSMLDRIPKEFDMVVGDTTIWAPRVENVEFSQPYSESGVVLVVKNMKPFDMWIFIKPLKWDLWLAIIVACIFMGVFLRILENQPNNTSTTDQPSQEKRGVTCFSPVTILAFPERNIASNNWSLIVLVFWIFMAFILMQSYTANLSAILTVDQLKFAFSDNYYVGYQDGSFMKKFLTEQLHISQTRLRSYVSAEGYHDAMTRGSSNGGIDAVFDEIPYMKLFLKKYDSKYKMVGPIYRTGGFGFAFPKGSILATHFSKAIIDITQGPNMTVMEKKNFGPGYSSQDPLTSTISQQTSSLTVFQFGGLFIIVGSVTAIALFFSATPIGRKLNKKMIHIYQHHIKKNCLHFRNSEGNRTEGGDKGNNMNGTLQDSSHHVITLPSSMPRCALLHRYCDLDEDKHISINLDHHMFGDDYKLLVNREDIMSIYGLNPITANCIVVYMWYLYKKMRKDNKIDRFSFVNPHVFPFMPNVDTKSKNGKAEHLNQVAGVLNERLSGASQDQLVLVPYNVGAHWILIVIHPYKNVAYFLDSMSHHECVEDLKLVVIMALTMFNSDEGREIKEQPTCDVLKTPQQPDTKLCGYYVMRFMRQIIHKDATSETDSIRSIFTESEYTMKEIDEVRFEWADCIEDHIFK